MPSQIGLFITPTYSFCSMESHTWQTVQLAEDSPIPDQRWGHAVTQVAEQIVIFGGYAYAQYMNDLWVFNTLNMNWDRIETTGDIPSERSNATLHYDSDRNRLILFGGGAAQQRRFRSVHSLDWETKHWTEVVAVQSQNAPWERSYHVSQILGHYLVVFGGESITDMGDLWIFDLITRQWKEVKMSGDKQSPRPRRFHSSAIIGSTIYVIGGTSGKVILGDIFSLDLSPFIETGVTSGLAWKKHALSESEGLTRWGHTSVAHEGKIYIYAGRNTYDLNGVLVIDPRRSTIKSLNIEGAEPDGRRRHSACFIGSNMVIFGGSSSEYYNDCHYINVFEPERSDSLISPSKIPRRQSNLTPYDAVLHSIEGDIVRIRKGTIALNFGSEQDLINFLFAIDHKHSKKDLEELINVLEVGYGKTSFPLELESLGVHIPMTEDEKNETLRSKVREQAKLILEETTEPIYIMQPQKYAEYVSNRGRKFADRQIVFNQKHVFHCNQALMASKSPYFEALFRLGPNKEVPINLDSEFGDHRLMKIIVNYVETGLLVVCEGLCDHCWIELCRAAQYFCLDSLFELSETYLTRLITPVNVYTYLEFGLKENLKYLMKSCALFIFKNRAEAGCLQELSELQVALEGSQGSREIFQHLSEMFAFDLAQIKLKTTTNSQEEVSEEEVFQDSAYCLVG